MLFLYRGVSHAAGSFRAERHAVLYTTPRAHSCSPGTHDRQTQQIQVAKYIGFDTLPLTTVLAMRSRGAPADNRQDDVERSWSSQLVVGMRPLQRSTRLFYDKARILPLRRAGAVEATNPSSMARRRQRPRRRFVDRCERLPKQATFERGRISKIRARLYPRN